MQVGEEGGFACLLYLSLHWHHQNNSSIKMGSDKSHFNVPLIVRDSRKSVSTNHLFEEKGQPKQNQAEARLF